MATGANVGQHHDWNDHRDSCAGNRVRRGCASTAPRSWTGATRSRTPQIKGGVPIGRLQLHSNGVAAGIHWKGLVLETFRRRAAADREGEPRDELAGPARRQAAARPASPSSVRVSGRSNRLTPRIRMTLGSRFGGRVGKTGGLSDDLKPCLNMSALVTERTPKSFARARTVSALFCSRSLALARPAIPFQWPKLLERYACASSSARKPIREMGIPSCFGVQNRVHERF